MVIAEGEDDGLRFAVLDDGLEFPVRARRFRDGLLAKFGGQIRQCDLIVLAQAQGPYANTMNCLYMTRCNKTGGS